MYATIEIRKWGCKIDNYRHLNSIHISHLNLHSGFANVISAVFISSSAQLNLACNMKQEPAIKRRSIMTIITLRVSRRQSLALTDHLFVIIQFYYSFHVYNEHRVCFLIANNKTSHHQGQSTYKEPHYPNLPA